MLKKNELGYSVAHQQQQNLAGYVRPFQPTSTNSAAVKPAVGSLSNKRQAFPASDAVMPNKKVATAVRTVPSVPVQVGVGAGVGASVRVATNAKAGASAAAVSAMANKAAALRAAASAAAAKITSLTAAASTAARVLPGPSVKTAGALPSVGGKSAAIAPTGIVPRAVIPTLGVPVRGAQPVGGALLPSLILPVAGDAPFMGASSTAITISTGTAANANLVAVVAGMHAAAPVVGAVDGGVSSWGEAAASLVAMSSAVPGVMTSSAGGSSVVPSTEATPATGVSPPATLMPLDCTLQDASSQP